MQIIKQEDKEKDGDIQVCENCKEEKRCRPVEAFGHTQESRGWYNICFDCFGPQVWWKENPLGKSGKVWMSPVS